MARNNNKKGKGSNVGAFLAGAAAATAAGAYFLYGSKGATERRKKVEAWTLKAKGEVLEKLENSKEISEDKYNQIVDKTTDKYSKTKNVTKDEAQKLGKELKAHWRRIKREVGGGSSVKETTNKVRNKVVEKIDADTKKR